MTVSTSNSVVILNANGSTHNFSFTFKIFAASDLKVIVRSTAGVETEKTLNSQYIIPTSSVENDSGGNILFKYNTGTSSDAHYSTTDYRPANGEKVILRREQTQTQSLDLVDNDPFSATLIEAQLDKITMMVQGLQEEIDRAIRFSRTNLLDSDGVQITSSYLEVLDNASTRANKLLGFTSTGALSAVQTYTEYYLGVYSSAPTTSVVGAFYFDSTLKKLRVWDGSQFVDSTSSVNGTANRYLYTVGSSSGSYNGSTTVFPATYDNSGDYVDVYLNGIKIESSTYDASNGTSITLNDAASSGDTVQIVGYGTFSLSNLTTADQTFNGDTTFGGDVAVSGTATYSKSMYEKTVAATLSNSDATATLDASLGNNFTLAVGTANITSVVFSSNSLPANSTFFFTIKITQHGSTPRTITWPSPFKWAGDQAMALSTSASKVDIAVGFTADQGSTIYIFEAGKDLS